MPQPHGDREADPHAPSRLVAPPRVTGRVGELSRWSTPNVAAGIRAAVATLLPILLVQALGIEGATWAGLAGFTTALVDRGGAYPTRAKTMAGLAVTAAVGGALGAVASGHPGLSIPVIFAFAAAGAMLRAFGAAAGSVGLTATNTLVISLSAPAHGWRDVAMRVVLLLAGSAVAMAMSLSFWPIRAYRPVRAALAECWRALAGYADAVANGEPRDFAGFRAALEEARATLAATRRGRTGESGRGERQVVGDRHGAAELLVRRVGDAHGGGVLYVQGGSLKYRGSSGTVTVLAPA